MPIKITKPEMPKKYFLVKGFFKHFYLITNHEIASITTYTIGKKNQHILHLLDGRNIKAKEITLLHY